ncbi:MAG: hypothetical protein ACPGPE_03535 [Planctomycetota bacterium]
MVEEGEIEGLRGDGTGVIRLTALSFDSAVEPSGTQVREPGGVDAAAVFWVGKRDT